MHRQAVGVLLALVAGAAAAASSSAAPAAAPSVTVRDGRVTASLRQAPLDAVIAALARETGAEVRGALPEPRTVTLDLDAVPLEAALERLLGSRSFTLTYDAEGRLKRLALPAGGATAAAAPPAGASAAGHGSGNPATDPNARVSEYVRGNPTVAVGGRLGRALGTNTATFQQVLHAALKDEDPRVRAQGRRVVVKTLVADPTVRDALVATLNGMPDDALARALRSIAGADAEELAIAFARHGRSPELSRRMHDVVGVLRRQGGAS